MKRTLIALLILIGITCLPLLSLLTPGLPVTHDGQDHVARIANFYASLSEGNIIPRWASNLNWGFGHPILMFLYPLPSYTASLFHAIGFSFVDSTKLVFGLGFIASVVLMFLWVTDAWGVEAGVVAAILYGFNPYRFVDLYVRGAIGEDTAFIFLPVILWGLYGLSQQRTRSRWFLILTLGIAGLLLSHNAISLMMIPVAAAYTAYLFFFETSERKKFLFAVGWSIITGFSLSAFFWVPALLEGKYTLRDIVTKGEIITRMVPFSWFFYSPWNYGQGDEFTKQVGLVHWISIIGGVFILIKSKTNKLRLLLFVIMGLFFGSLIVQTSLTIPIWSHVMLMQNFQFPWRILTITVLLSSMIGAIFTSQLSFHWKRRFVGIVIIFFLLSTLSMWKPKAYKTYDPSFFINVYKGTTDTGESSPIWSVRFMEYQPEVPMEIASGSATISTTKRTTTVREYSVDAKEKTRLVENTLYFPGWHVYVDGQDTTIEFQDPHWRGRITFWVDKGTHTIRVVFKETKLRNISDLVSFLSSVGLLILLIVAIFQKKKLKPGSGIKEVKNRNKRNKK